MRDVVVDMLAVVAVHAMYQAHAAEEVASSTEGCQGEQLAQLFASTWCSDGVYCQEEHQYFRQGFPRRHLCIGRNVHLIGSATNCS